MRLKSLLLIAILPIAMMFGCAQFAHCDPYLKPETAIAQTMEPLPRFPTDYLTRSYPDMLIALELSADTKNWIAAREPRDKEYRLLTNGTERANLAREYNSDYCSSKYEKKQNEFIANELNWIEHFWQSRCSEIRDLEFQNYKPPTNKQKKHLQNFLLTSLIDNLELQCRLVDEVTQYPRGKYKFQNQKREAEYLELRAHQKAVIELKKLNKYEGPLEEAKIREALSAVTTK